MKLHANGPARQEDAMDLASALATGVICGMRESASRDIPRMRQETG